MRQPLTALGLGLALGLASCGGHDASPRVLVAATPGTTAPDALWSQLAVIDQRLELVRDSKDIKRLQRAYGYYLDNALWDELADLFSDQATLEIGLDGVYRGRDHIRAYFLALGHGKQGLEPGQLNEHLQLMPVVTVAPDGRSAKGRWRDIILAGQLGDHAVWGEGPFENEYVKEDGVWKISKLHWFQTMLVPFEGGWHQNVDYNGAHWVAAEDLPPDAPTTFEYDPWPGTFLPPFHFANPVVGAVATDLARFASPIEHADQSVATLARAATEAERKIARLEDEDAIEKLQRIYGYYIEKGFWTEAAHLFTDDGVYEIPGFGEFKGQDRVLAYLESIGPEFPQEGRLYDQMQLMPIVDVAPDGRTAKARWRLFAQEAKHGDFAEWGTGWYENDYVKQDGVWKIAHLRRYIRMYSPDQEGWGKTALPWPTYQLRAGLKPDAPSPIDYAPYPAVPDPDFHYANPVTGEPVYANVAGFGEAPDLADADAAAAWIAGLDDRAERLEDVEQIERLQSIYGYYLARYKMDDLAGIFADDGTIEIALRGVYAGKASVRRNLDLYPPVDLHNHMQYEPVIDIAADGLSAKLRSRAFSIMGSYGQYSMWMGGIYENDYVKQDGIWKIEHDHVFNTYFVNYADGWKDNPPRPPPGISEDNPPDSPPTMNFEMYPSAFLPPYHYPNPVTGETVSWSADGD